MKLYCFFIIKRLNYGIIDSFIFLISLFLVIIEIKIQDHQGSVIALVDSSGTKVEEYKYDAYGKVTSKNSTATTHNPYGYTGRIMDDNDLYYYRARYYDPTSQRFLSEDPIGFSSGDFNFYRYVGNSPVSFVDPQGLWIANVIGAVINMGFEGYHQYQSGEFNAGRLVVAGVTGALGGFGSTALRAIGFGAASGALNNAYQQLDNKCNKPFDWGQLGRSAAYGGAGGVIGYGGGKIGNNIYRPVNVIGRDINNIPAPHYGTHGTAIGSTVGGYVGNQ